jgi:hypothetical protein
MWIGVYLALFLSVSETAVASKLLRCPTNVTQSAFDFLNDQDLELRVFTPLL